MFNWLGAITAVIGIGVSAYSTYVAAKAEEEKAEEMRGLLAKEAEYKAKQRDMEKLSKQRQLEKATRARKATVANLMYNRGFSAEAIRDPFKRLETEFGSATKQLEESASLAGSIDDITLEQAQLQATPADTGLGTILTSAAGSTLSLAGGIMIEENYNPFSSSEPGGWTSSKGTFDKKGKPI
jgi:coproporphyrinogen III oxidase-like Fe-S oxidoreductase